MSDIAIALWFSNWEMKSELCLSDAAMPGWVEFIEVMKKK